MLFWVVMASTILWQVLASAVLVRVLDPVFTPNLGLLWIIVLADRTPSTPAREGDFWISGLSLSVLIGYVLDLFYLAPRGLYMSVYGAAFLLLRAMTDKLAQGGFVRLVLTVSATSFALDLGIWWVKGLITGFATVASFSPLVFAFSAATNGIVGGVLIPSLAAPFDERSEGFR